jgi:hypothetical protein
MHDDRKTFRHFDTVLYKMGDASRGRAGSQDWLPALVLMAIRVASARSRPGGWRENIAGYRRDSLEDLRRWIFIVLGSIGNDIAAERLTDMVFRVNEATLRAWQSLVEQLDLDGDGEAVCAFAEWFGERLDGPELWSGGSYGVVVPPHIARLMGSLVEVRPGMSVLDPACGVGGLLAAAWQEKLRTAENGLRGPDLNLFGIEHNLDVLAVVQLRLYLLGVPVDQRSTALTGHYWRVLPNHVDVVLSAPPAGTMYERTDLEMGGRWHWFPNRVSAEAAITMLTLEKLAPDGGAVLLIPKGMLFRGGDDARLRRILMQDGVVSAVISLPAGILAPLTHIETALLVLRKRDNAIGFPAIMIDASDAGSRERRRVFLSEEECATILRLVRGEAIEPGAIRVRPVFADMIEEADFDLRPERYIEREHATERLSLEDRRLAVQSLEREYQSVVQETDALIERLMKCN